MTKSSRSSTIFLIFIVSSLVAGNTYDTYKLELKKVIENIESINIKNDFFHRISPDPDVDMTTIELIKKEGYPAEAYEVETKDGYLLTLHRIPGAPNSPPVFLQHGLLASSFDYVVAGKNKSIAFILSDRGYDVWMGNARGNTYSRSHILYPVKDLRFWNFSWHEMGIYDLPAAISFVLNKTNEKDLIYIGHSMGTSMFYAMASEIPDVASKVKVMFSLAPIAFMSHLKSPARLFVPFIRELEIISHYLGEGEFLPQNSFIRFLARYGCDIDVAEEKVCANVLFVLAGFDTSMFNYTLLPRILSHSPAGASTKSLIHYGQEISTGKFCKYDYGSKKNLEYYNKTTPPNYDLTKIKVPVALFWADNDWLASPIDVKGLSNILPNVVLNYHVPYPKFNHLDFLWATGAPTLIYSKILDFMEKYR